MKALAGLAVGAFAASATTHAAPAAKGLLLRIEGGGATDTTIASNAWLRVEGGASPSPFIQPGPFTAVWTGTISIDLRGDYQFQAAFAVASLLALLAVVALVLKAIAERGASAAQSDE